MALAMAFDDAKTDQIRSKGDGRDLIGEALITPFFVNSRDTPDLPWAGLAQWDPGRLSCAHFHTADQFQIVVDGKGKIGRHDLSPYDVHFSRAYTPYGPLLSDAGTGLTFFALRAHYDPGSQSLAANEDKLRLVANRQPWQITLPAIFPTVQSGTATADSMLQRVSGIKDEQGLAAYTLSMKANAQSAAPDPSSGDGQYLVVVKGSLLHDNKEHKALALVFIRPDEGAFRIDAGPGGLQALILNFPRPGPRIHITRAATSVRTGTDFKIWRCALCEFVYDEGAGRPEEGIPPGTRWKDVPETWTCPDCSSSKGDFQMVELEN